LKGQYGKKRIGGRNNSGRLTIKGQGGGVKRKYRVIEFKGIGIVGKIEKIEYDPNRTAMVAKIRGKRIIVSKGMKIGDEIRRLENIERIRGRGEINMGEHIRLSEMAVGTKIYNIDGKYIRAGGVYGIIMGMHNGKVMIKMPSKELKDFRGEIKAVIGEIEHRASNMIERGLVSVGKAGRSRRLGRRPSVRGIVKNPTDHPHGGSTLGKQPRTMSGRLAKGVKTRKRR
jgi:large subunit ribosomal protein L2